VSRASRRTPFDGSALPPHVSGSAGSGMITASLDTPRVLTIKTYAVLGAPLAGAYHPRQAGIDGRPTPPQ
jgi:hypothetical protein